MKKTKIKLIRFVSVLLLIMTAAQLLVSCTKEPDTNTEGTGETTDGSGENVDTSQTEPPANENVLQPLVIDGVAQYCVVYDKEGIENTAYLAGNVVKKLNEVSQNVVFFERFNIDKIPTEGYKYIFVGKVGKYTEKIYSELKYKDYSITVEDGNIYIAGWTETALQNVLEHFYTAFVIDGGISYIDTQKVKYSRKVVYDLPLIELCNVSLSEYSIIYGDDFSGAYAQKVSNILGELTGNVISVYRDTEKAVSEYEILFGKTNRNPNDELLEKRISVKVDGTRLKVLFDDDVAAEMICGAFLDAAYKANPKEVFKVEQLATEMTLDDSIRMATYNVLWGWTDDDSSRGKKICELVIKNNIDILCLQEYTDENRNSKYGIMKQLSDIYSEVTVNGQDMNKVWCPIFYNKDKFTLINSGTADMYENGVPCQEYFTESGARNTWHRRVLWGILEDKVTKQRYLIGNLHTSANGATHGSEAQFIMSQLAAVRAQYPDAVVLVAGDYNSYPGSAACGAMMNSGYLNTNDLAHIKGRNVARMNIVGIDQILAANNHSITVEAYVSLYWRGISEFSDHTPVVISFKRNS